MLVAAFVTQVGIADGEVDRNSRPAGHGNGKKPRLDLALVFCWTLSEKHSLDATEGE